MASTKVDWGQYADEQDKLASKVTREDSRGKYITHLLERDSLRVYNVHLMRQEITRSSWNSRFIFLSLSPFVR